MSKNISIIKSDFDYKKYEVLVLENKLKIILIEDDESVMDDVAMGVGVGYMHDTINGIAHFLEHMLFIGNKKYPSLNYFTNFIKQNGGVANAYTSHDHTCYYYSVKADSLYDSVDIFSRFFIDPTFDKKYVDKEINAVNEEHMKNINNDSWRYEDIIKVACNENHSWRKFGTGNTKTLKIDNIYDKLLEFYNDYYSSDNMILIIKTSNKLASVKPIIKKIFSEIPFKTILKKPRDNTDISGNLIKKGLQLNMIPMQSINTFSIYWDLKSNETVNFFIYLMSNKSLNSLDSILNKLELTNEYACSINNHIGDRDLVKTTFILTEKGLKNRDLIIKLLYDYIDIIKDNLSTGKIENLYNEYIKFNRNDFIYRSSACNIDDLLEYIHLILSYRIDINNLLVYTSIPQKYDTVKRNLNEIFNFINLENSIIILGSHDCENCNKTDKFYGTKYSVNKLNTIINNKINYKYTLELQKANSYIPENFSLIKTSNNIKKPILLSKNNNTLAYHFPYTYFKLPLVNIDICIDLYNLVENNMIYLGTMFYLYTVFDRIKPEIYLMNLAGYNVTIFVNNSKLIISISGYSDKIHKVVNFLIDEISRFECEDISIFNKTRNMTKLISENNIMNLPYLKVNDIFYKNALKKYYDSSDILSYLDKMTQNNIVEIAKYIFSNIKISSLFTGNITKENALYINDKFETLKKYLCNQNSCIKTRLTNNFISITKDIEKNKIINISQKSMNPHEQNNCVAIYVHLFNVKYSKDTDWNFNIAMSDVLNTIIGEQFFSNLRTVEQFGYIVSTKIEIIGQVTDLAYFIKFVIQSSGKSTDEMVSRTNKFIKEFLDYLQLMTVKNLNNFVHGKKEMYLYVSNDLDEISDDYFNQLVLNYPVFDYREKMIEGYESITKKNLIDFYIEKFINKCSGYCISLEKYK